jgi:hypothetical protein
MVPNFPLYLTQSIRYVIIIPHTLLFLFSLPIADVPPPKIRQNTHKRNNFNKLARERERSEEISV